ncbi:MAG: hypothetical protein JWO11_3609 [Nocardioides sp.]|nr:hypothetical protein [Nocardioides sp.]
MASVMDMTKSSYDFSKWTTGQLTHAIKSDEGVLAKEGDRSLTVDQDVLKAMKAERTSRWIEANR